MKHLHRIKTGIAIFLFGVSGAILAGLYWAYGIFGKQIFIQIWFHLQEPLNGSNWASFWPGAVWFVGFGLLFAGIGFASYKLFNSDKVLALSIGKCNIKFSLDFWRRHMLVPALFILGVSVMSAWDFFGMEEYVKSNLQKTKIYNQYYVDPAETNITFPEEKRNLIYIYLESMETTFMSSEIGGAEYDNFMPNLYSLAVENDNFSDSGSITGAYSSFGTTWTMGSLVAQTCGIPLNMPIDGNAFGDHTDYFEGAYSIGEVLEKEGYTQVFLIGSDAGFAGRDAFFTNHGNYKMEDYYYAISEGWIPEDYYEWWGYEDEKLFSNAKNELLALAEKGEPFNMTILTADTHFYDGYVCELCESPYGEDQYANVISCSDRQIMEFVSWIQEQAFYENTTIVICGDHPTMDLNYVERTAVVDIQEYSRNVYTVIINPANVYSLSMDRSYTTMDMYPTTLAALGATIEGDRLGLGTNLYSETPTLLEIMGPDMLDEELAKRSRYYEKNILYSGVTSTDD